MATLVILAAGVGSRYGKGIKQFEKIGPQGETLMEYSVRDAVAAGFDNIIFVIRPDIYAEFIEIEQRIKGVRYSIVFQEIPKGRTKPMGTGQAVMLCKEYITEPFAVINADDYYGAEAYRKAYTFLCDGAGYGMIAYNLEDTLCSSRTVTRGICEIDNAGYITGIKETRNVTGGYKNKIVSMNFWLLPPVFINILADEYDRYKEEEQDEYLLPDVVDRLIEQKKIKIKMIKINNKCYGMTYKSDKEKVQEFITAITPPRGV